MGNKTNWFSEGPDFKSCYISRLSRQQHEVFGLVITPLYQIKIRAVRWKVSDQSSGTIYNAVVWKT